MNIFLLVLFDIGIYCDIFTTILSSFLFMLFVFQFLSLIVIFKPISSEKYFTRRKYELLLLKLNLGLALTGFRTIQARFQTI